jgi:hypothetical protein
LLYIHTT